MQVEQKIPNHKFQITNKFQIINFKEVKIKSNKLIAPAVLGYFLMPEIALAALVPCAGTPDDPCEVADFIGMLVSIYNWLLGFSALVAMIMIVYGGLKMFYWNFMEAKEQELEAAKLTVTRAIFGLIIVAAAYVVVNTVIALLSGNSKSIGDFISNLGIQ